MKFVATSISMGSLYRMLFEIRCIVKQKFIVKHNPLKYLKTP